MGLDNEDIKTLIAILQKGLVSDEEPPATTKNTKTRTKKSTSKKKNNINSKQSKKSTNKFLTMREKDMHKADTLIDRKLRVAPLTERTRQFKPIHVQCCMCGKQEDVNPVIMQDRSRYKCNKCSATAG